MSKTCQNCKQDFTIEPADFDFYKKIDVPPPTFCWRCRAIRRMAFRNMRHLYARTCAATGKKIYTIVPPESPIPVYDNDYWRSDAWDPMQYGRDYDFSRPFFAQMKDLFNAVPFGIIWSVDQVNVEYGISAFSKNCYLSFDSGYDEDCLYNVTALYSKRCVDCLNVKDCELCYYSINTNQSYKTFFSRNCVSCVDTWFSQDCTGCSNVFGCSGQRNKKYCIFNEQYSKEEYEKKLKEFKLDSWSGIQAARKQAEEFWRKSPVKYQHGFQVTLSSGDYLFNGTELVNCFFVGTAQNMRHCQSVIYPPNKDSMDLTSSEGTELCYETIACGGVVRKNVGCFESQSVTDAYYSINCRQVADAFGCVALKGKNYCILNKQYSKEEYFALLPRIKKHMEEMPYVDAQGRVYKFGEFFPFDFAPHGYSQSQAFDYFPVTEPEAKGKGYRWRLPDERKYSITKKASELPDSISEVSDEILKETIQCAHKESGGHSFGCDVDCSSAFRITKAELDFYRQMNLPLPRLCFNCRHIDRVQWRNVPALYDRQCAKCQAPIKTSYAPDRPEIVYCESCYNAEMV